MKTFLIAAGVLMTGASIYGVVDYNRKMHDKEFKELYKKEQVKTDVQTDQKSTEKLLGTVSDNAQKNVKDVTTSNETEKPKPVVKTSKRKFNIREFSRAPLRPEPIKELTSNEEK